MWGVFCTKKKIASHENEKCPLIQTFLAVNLSQGIKNKKKTYTKA